MGSTQQINWSSTGFANVNTTVGITLWNSAKTNQVAFICASCAIGSGTNSRAWTIPTFGIPAGQYVIRIATLDSSMPIYSDSSDAPFSIVAASSGGGGGGGSGGSTGAVALNSSQTASILEAIKPIWWPLGF